MSSLFNLTKWSYIIVFMIFIVSCNKKVENTIENPFKSEIINELKLKMSNEQFSDLNFEKLLLSNNVGSIQVAQIPFKNNSNSILFFGKNNEKYEYNIVQQLNRVVINGKVSEIMNIKSINGEILNTYKIVNNKIVAISNSINSIVKKSNTDGTEPIIEGSGGDVIVTGFRTTSGLIDYFSLYYIFNNPMYYNYYSCEYLQAETDYSNGNSNSVLAYLPFGKPFVINNYIPIKIGDSKLFDLVDNKTYTFQNGNIQFKLDNNNKLVENSTNVSFTGIVAGEFKSNTYQNFNPVYFNPKDIYFEHQGIWGYQMISFKMSVLIGIKEFTDLDGITKYNITIDYANR